MALINGKQLLDGSISSDKLATTATAWKGPVAVKHLVGNYTETEIEALSPAQGDAYVVELVNGDSTIDGTAAAVGDIFEHDGSTWQKIVAGSAGFVPAGTRALIATQTALTGPATYTTSQDEGKIVEFSGSSLVGTDTGEALDGYSVAVNGDGGVFEHNILVFSGTVPSGSWAGGGDIVAGEGLTKTVNTLNVGDANKGVQVNTDNLEIDANEIAGDGLVQNGVNSHVLDVQVTDFAGAGLEGDGSNNLRIAATAAGAGLTGGAGSALAVNASNGVEVVTDTVQLDLLLNGGLQLTGTEVGVKVADFDGTGLEDDGSNNLRIAAAAAGDGLTGGAGSALAVESDITTGGDVVPVDVGANGVGFDVSAIDGVGIEATGAGLLQLSTQGNGITGGAGSTLSVLSDVTTGGDNEPIAVGANGISLAVGNIAGTGLEADGSANLRIAAAAAGAGLAGGGGSALSVTASNGVEVVADTVQLDLLAAGGLELTGTEVGVNVGDFVGTGLEDDLSNNIRIAASAAGTGLTGGGGSALAVDTASTVTFSGASWTFPTDELQVTGTPASANDSVNKAYVDSAVSGLQWRQPVLGNLRGNLVVTGLVGQAAETAIEATTPAAGDAYVVNSLDGDSNIGGDVAVAVGDIVQWSGTAWAIAVAHSSNFPPLSLFAALHDTETLVGTGYTTASAGDIVDFGGASLAPSNNNSPAAGDQFVIGDNGTVSGTDVNEGDYIEWTGTAYQTLVTNSGGFVPVDHRAITGLTVPVDLILPYVDTTDDGKIVEFSGSSNTATETVPVEATDGSSVLIQDDAHVGVRDNTAFVFEGTVPNGDWIQWSGSADVNAGAGLTKTSNVIDIGDANKGVQVNTDNLEIDANEIAGDGLVANGVNTYVLDVQVTDFAGTGIESDGSNNLRIAAAAAGNGLTGGAGSALSVQADATTGGDNVAVSVGANGVSFDVSAIDGDGLLADGAGVIDVQADSTTGANVKPVNITANGVGFDFSTVDGNGLLVDGSGNLDVQADSTTGGNVKPVNVTANGVGFDVSGIDGNGLAADGSGNLTVQADGTSIEVGASGIKAPVPYLGDKYQQASATSGNGQDSGLDIGKTPSGDGWVQVMVNGVQYQLGDGVKTTDCYFSGDAGANARGIDEIQANDSLYWNGVVAGFDLATTDYLDFNYNVTDLA